MAEARLGVIGGSGLYDLPGLTDRHVEDPDFTTPFGQPSAPPVTGQLEGTEIVFIARHGIGHRFSPSDLPYRANVHAFRQLGVTHLLSISAVGSLSERFAPGHLLIPDQITDRTTGRKRTFFGDGIVAHVGIASPFCPHLRSALHSAAGRADAAIHDGGSYVCIEGPQFSTRAESELHRSWGASVVGMTAMPEARLAREAELCYATLALITDYDVWHETESDVSVDLVMANLARSVEASRQTIRELSKSGLPDRTCGCGTALDGAISTDPAVMPAATHDRLGLLLGRLQLGDA